MISEQTKEYFELGKRNDVREHAKRLRRQFLRYKDAEIVYSIHHKKLLEMANKAGAIYRIDGTVLITGISSISIWSNFMSPVPLRKRRKNNEREPVDVF